MADVQAALQNVRAAVQALAALPDWDILKAHAESDLQARELENEKNILRELLHRTEIRRITEERRRHRVEEAMTSAIEDAMTSAIEELEASGPYLAWKHESEVQHRTNYRSLFESGAMQPVINVLSQERLPAVSLAELHRRTGFPLNTLKGWRHDLRSDPPHVPYAQPANISKRGLTPEQEESLAQRIQSDFIDVKKYCPPRLVQTMAREIHREAQQTVGGDGAVASGEEEEDEAIPCDDDEFLPGEAEARRPFQASRRWRGEFLKRHGFSIRKPHAKRRPTVTPEQIVAFRVRIQNVMHSYPLERIINMDETSWKLLNTGFTTVTRTGSEAVECLFKGDPKMCLTAIAATDAAGNKLPLWILCRGKTPRCEQRYRSNEVIARYIARGELIVSHQHNGWTDDDVADAYLRWLKSRFQSGPIALIWDVFAAHRSTRAKAVAESLSIELDFIPPGATGDCQPLDCRIFGNLKSRARRRFDDFWGGDQDPTMEDSIRMLLEAWQSIGQDEILDAWNTAMH